MPALRRAREDRLGNRSQLVAYGLRDAWISFEEAIPPNGWMGPIAALACIASAQAETGIPDGRDAAATPLLDADRCDAFIATPLPMPARGPTGGRTFPLKSRDNRSSREPIGCC